ncbi:MAG TPA: M23 family metallopeptidase, partial [Candidatus Nanopelagicales bacterium]
MSRRLPRPVLLTPAGGRPLGWAWAGALGVALLLGLSTPPAAAGALVIGAGDTRADTRATTPSRPPGSWAAATASATAPGLDASRWRLPLWPTRVTRAFANPPHNWLPGHRGVDLRGVPGEPVRAAGAGRVTFAARLAGRGVVVVDHGELRTTYEPVEAIVLPGQHVRRGA